jgi:Zn-dependent peptidase ImmA (M78 family)/DNA-binding XRE family transcriptional regulator
MNNRLKQLRLARGYSLDDLSARIGGLVTKQALSKYEKGVMQPSASVLKSLADALEIKASELLRSPTHEITLLAFRKMASMGAKEEESIKALVQVEFEKRLLLQGRISGRQQIGINLGGYEAPDEKTADAMAEKLRADLRLGVDPIGNMTALLEDYAIHVISLDTSRKFDGFSAVAKDHKGIPMSAAVVCRSNVTGDRQRLTLAHELGHLVLKECDEQKAEKLAYRFGAAFLVPRETLIKEVGEKRTSLNVKELLLLKARFGVSVQALVRRMRDLEIISEPTYKSACITISRMGWRSKEPGSPIPAEHSTWLEQAALRAWSEGLIDDTEIQSLIGSVPTQASETSSIRRKEFLKLSKAKRDLILQEQAKTLEAHYAASSDWDRLESEDWQ